MRNFLKHNMNVIVGIVCMIYVLITLIFFKDYETNKDVVFKTFLNVLIAFCSGMNIGISICGKDDTEDGKKKD